MNLKNVILADTSALLALLNKKDVYYETVKPFATANLLVSSTVLCVFNYMATKYLLPNLNTKAVPNLETIQKNLRECLQLSELPQNDIVFDNSAISEEKFRVEVIKDENTGNRLIILDTSGKNQS